MIGFLISALKIIFLLGFLIFIHELGHFTVAKLCNVKVNEFAIGFGPTIWKKQGKETQYALRLIPLGGFVSMEGDDEKSEDSRSFSKASIPKRILICLAGATVNIVFGLTIYFILTSTANTYVTNEITSVIDGYAAQEIGIESGDIITQINDKKVNSKYDLDNILEKTKGEEIKIIVERDGKKLEFTTKPSEIKAKSTGMYLDDKAKVSAVEKGSSSEKYGIKANDRIIKVNNQEINEDTDKILEILNKEDSDKLLLTIKRGEEEINIELVPDYVSTYYLGVSLKQSENTFMNHLIYGGIETKEFVFSIIDNLKMLVTGNVGVDQMMGPVGISEIVAKTDGFKDFISLMALISLSLGVTNLLPIPALDGGKILILLIEAVRRKPMNEKTEINIQLLGFAILIGLSIYVTYNDVLRIFF